MRLISQLIIIKIFKFIKSDLNNSKDIDKIINIIKKNNIKFIVNFASQGMVAESWITPRLVPN